MTSTTNTMSKESRSAQMLKLDIADGLATITIDLPDSKVNTLGEQSMTQLNEAVDKIIAGQSKIHGVVIRSGKADNFIAGADVKEIQQLQKRQQIEIYEASQSGKQLFAKLDALPMRVVAEINGICLGGGTEMVLACDYRIASSKAKIGLPEVMLGFIPGWGACIRLPKLLGVASALNLIMTGRILEAKKAWKTGLIDEVVEPERLSERAREIALGAAPRRSSRRLQDMAMSLVLETNSLGLSLIRNQAYAAMMKETKGKYPAPKEALNVVLKGVDLPPEKGFELESRTFARLATTEISKNIVSIFFAQTESKKMPPDLKEKPVIKTVGVLGAGVMGAGIAQAAAKAGYKVIVKDVEQKFLDKGKATVIGLFDKIVERRRMKREEADKVVSAMVFTTDYAAMNDCDLVIEAVIEDIKTKQTALAELDKVIRKPYVFASNTSSLSINEIAKGTNDPSKVVGLHFFNPVHKMPLVEVVRGDKTSDLALATAMTLALKLDKTTVIAKDSPGFIVNRILAPYMREAAVMAAEGTPIEDIDKAMKSFGMKMGPFALLDMVGLDVAGKVIQVMHAALGERLAPPALMQEIDKLKLLGEKDGKGIFLYEDGRATGVNPEVQALVRAEVKKKTPSEIQDRLVLLMLNEAARCLEEGVVTDPAQLDLALIFGTGFPPFLGGVLRYADSRGIDIVYENLDYIARVIGDRYKPSRLLQEKHEKEAVFYSC